MKPSEAIDTLTKAMQAEGALSVELQNIASTFIWSGLPEKQRRQAMESIAAIAALPARRARRLRSLIEQLQGSEQDVL